MLYYYYIMVTVYFFVISFQEKVCNSFVYVVVRIKLG